MFSRDALEALDPLEFALEGTLIVECVPPHDFGRAENTGGPAARQPDFAVRPAADAPQQFVIRDNLPDGQSGTGIEHRAARLTAPGGNSRKTGPCNSARRIRLHKGRALRCQSILIVQIILSCSMLQSVESNTNRRARNVNLE